MGQIAAQYGKPGQEGSLPRALCRRLDQRLIKPLQQQVQLCNRNLLWANRAVVDAGRQIAPDRQLITLRAQVGTSGAAPSHIRKMVLAQLVKIQSGLQSQLYLIRSQLKVEMSGINRILVHFKMNLTNSFLLKSPNGPRLELLMT